MPSTIPINQLHALPLVTAAEFTGEIVNPGTVNVIGGSLVRFWSASSLGWSGVNFTADPAQASASLLLSPFLDFTAVNHFQLLVVRTATLAAGDTAESISVNVQFGLAGGADNPTGSGAGFGTSFSDQVTLGTFAIRGGPYPQTTMMTKGFGWANTASTAGTQTCGRARLWLRRSVVPNVDQLYTISLWAQS